MALAAAMFASARFCSIVHRSTCTWTPAISIRLGRALEADAQALRAHHAGVK
jgi:hypothetical protein